jgi:Na+/H+ antiporter NhaC
MEEALKAIGRILLFLASCIIGSMVGCIIGCIMGPAKIVGFLGVGGDSKPKTDSQQADQI